MSPVFHFHYFCPHYFPLFSVDLEGALRSKMAIMRAHWRDVEKHLAPPHK